MRTHLESHSLFADDARGIISSRRVAIFALVNNLFRAAITGIISIAMVSATVSAPLAMKTKHIKK